jgi:hypothetical protein
MRQPTLHFIAVLARLLDLLPCYALQLETLRQLQGSRSRRLQVGLVRAVIGNIAINGSL